MKPNVAARVAGLTTEYPRAGTANALGDRGGLAIRWRKNLT
jgi:hypothetical protein